MAIWTGLLISSCSLAVGFGGFYCLNVMPARRKKRRFFDLAMGHDGADGLPAQPNIFTRMEAMEGRLAAPLLNGKGDDLIKTVARLDARTERQGRELVAIRKQLHLPAQRPATD